MQTFPCFYLEGEVELTDEREAHIARTHPDLLPEYLAEIGHTLADPDQVHWRREKWNGAETDLCI